MSMSLQEWRQDAIKALAKQLPGEKDFAADIIDWLLIQRLDEIMEAVDDPKIANDFAKEYWEDQEPDGAPF